jgi:hypothetical protein
MAIYMQEASKNIDTKKCNNNPNLPPPRLPNLSKTPEVKRKVTIYQTIFSPSSSPPPLTPTPIPH